MSDLENLARDITALGKKAHDVSIALTASARAIPAMQEQASRVKRQVGEGTQILMAQLQAAQQYVGQASKSTAEVEKLAQQMATFLVGGPASPPNPWA